MGLYEQALTKYKLDEAVRQQSQLNIPEGADSERPHYVQRLDNLSKNQVYATVAESVNYSDPGILDRAVSIPGRFAHQIAKGFVDSTADLVELPELIVNHVGNNLGWDENDRLDVLSNVAKRVRGTVDMAQGQQSIADKIAYYVGYSIPDLAGIILGGVGGAKTIGTGLARLGVRGTVQISEKTALALGSAMGRISYGAVKGGAFGGQEGAVAGAKQYTIMEAGMAALGRYNLPIRVLGSALLNGGMAAATTDSNRPDYQDEVVAAAILGGMFAALPQHQQDRISRDPITAQDKVKAYVARERALGRTPELNGVLAEFAERDWNYMRAAYIQDPNATTPIMDLKKNLELTYGKGGVSDDRAMLAKQLQAVIFDAGDLNPGKSLLLAENFVRTAEYLSDPDTISGPAVIERFVDAHRDMLIIPKKKSYEVINKQSVVDDSGITLELTEKQARDWKIEKAQEVIRNKSLEAQNVRRNAPVTGWLSKGWESLVNPEGKAFDKLLNIPMGPELQRQVKHKAYDVPDMVSFFEKQVDKAANFAGFEGKSREILDTLATIAWHEDKRTIWRGQKKKDTPELPWSEDLVDAKKQFVYKWIDENAGPEGRAKYENALRVGFKTLQDLNVKKFESGIIGEKTLQAYNANEFLPDKRAVRWRPNKTLYDVESSVLLKDDPIFHETFGFSRIDPRLTEATGEPMVLDFEYLVKSEMRKQEFAISKNNLLRTWYDAAVKGEGDIAQYARLPKKRYKIEGLTGFLDEGQAKEIITLNERIHRAMHNARDRRNEKLANGEYTTRKKPGPKEPTLAEIKAEIAELQKNVESLRKKDAKLTDWAMQDFDTYDVASVKHIEDRGHPKDTIIHDATHDYVTVKSMRDELRTQKEQLEWMTKLKKIEEVIEPMHGFEAVPFLRDGKVEYVMLDREAARMTNMSHNVTKLQQKVYRAMSFASGVAPVKFFATAINPVFPIRRWWADNMHFYTANDFERGNILKFTKDALLEQPGIFKDVISDGEWATKYKSLGGNVLTVTKIAQEDILLRKYNDIQMSNKGRSGWEKFVDRMGWLGTNIETTIRVHQFKKMVESGIPEKTAVRRVNDMLNFGRKGNFMRAVDSIYPFANVAAQALDAQIKAAKGNPKLYAAKLGQYWALRLTGAWTAYTLAGYCMDDVSPYHKVNNFILPLGVTTKDENGDVSHAYLAIPTDNSPIVRAIDTLMFAGIDIMRDKTNTLGYEEILKRVSQDVPIYDTSSFLPAIAAFRAAWRNKDPRTGDNIWKGSEFVEPALRAYPDTSNLAKSAAQVLPGDVSPVGIERAASMVGSNPITSFMGYLLRDVTPEEKNSMFRTITDAGPGLNSIFKWTRPQTAIINTIRRESASAREKNVGRIVDDAIQKIKEESKPYQVIAKDIVSQKELNSLEKRDALRLVKDNLKGWKLYKHYMDQQGDEFIYDIPSYREWQAISTADVESKARWYKANLPPRDDVAYEPYRNLSKAFGFLRSQKFFYYLRQVEKGK
jgi:hypothetical protein